MSLFLFLSLLFFWREWVCLSLCVFFPGAFFLGFEKCVFILGVGGGVFSLLKLFATGDGLFHA